MPGAAGLPDLAVLQQRRGERHQALQGALISGAPTKPIRQAIREIDRATKALGKLEKLAEQTAATERAERVDAAAQTLAGDAVARIAAALDGLTISTETPNSEDTQATIAGAAQVIAEARFDLGQAQGVLREAEAEGDSLRRRIASVDHAKAQIIARRMGGTERQSDAEDIALLTADAEGLAILLGEAERAVAAAKGPVAEAQTMVARATGELSRAEDATIMAALTQRANQLGAGLLTTLTRIEELRARTGGKPNWSPGGKLYAVVRKSAAQHGLL